MNTESLLLFHDMSTLSEPVIEQPTVADDVPEISSLPNYLREWLQLEDEVKVLSAAMREKKKRMNMLQVLITKTMKGHKVARVNIKSGAVVYQSKSTKETMSKKFLLTHATEFFNGDAQKAKELLSFLEERRGKKEKDNLKLERT